MDGQFYAYILMHDGTVHFSTLHTSDPKVAKDRIGTIRLADSTSGFGDSKIPRPLYSTSDHFTFSVMRERLMYWHEDEPKSEVYARQLLWDKFFKTFPLCADTPIATVDSRSLQMMAGSIMTLPLEQRVLYFDFLVEHLQLSVERFPYELTNYCPPRRNPVDFRVVVWPTPAWVLFKRILAESNRGRYLSRRGRG